MLSERTCVVQAVAFERAATLTLRANCQHSRWRVWLLDTDTLQSSQLFATPRYARNSTRVSHCPAYAQMPGYRVLWCSELPLLAVLCARVM